MKASSAAQPAVSIRPLDPNERAAALRVINQSARWYAEFLPPDQLHGQEMTPEEFDAESARVRWYGAFEGDRLVAVMALEPKGELALVRHGYVLPARQRQGVGGLLLAHLERAAGVERIVIGTYAANYKARSSLEKSGYRLCADSAAVLGAYFDIDPERSRTSVAYEKSMRPKGSR
jgi:GNAT superfamily N-acetyltransferase